MIVAKMTNKQEPEKETLVFAITAENIVKLLQGKPIEKDLREFGVLGNVHILIAYAPTMEDHLAIINAIKDDGPLPGAKVTSPGH